MDVDTEALGFYILSQQVMTLWQKVFGFYHCVWSHCVTGFLDFITVGDDTVAEGT